MRRLPEQVRVCLGEDVAKDFRRYVRCPRLGVIATVADDVDDDPESEANADAVARKREHGKSCDGWLRDRAHECGAHERTGRDHAERETIDDARELAERLLAAQHLHVDLELAAAQHVGDVADVFGGARETAGGAVEADDEVACHLLELVHRGFLAAEVSVDDIDHVEAAHEVNERAFERDQTAGNGGEAARQLELAFTHGVGDVGEECADVYLVHFRRCVSVDDAVERAEQTGMVDGVDVSADREADKRVLEHGRALMADGDDDARETCALVGRKTPHVAKIEVDDAAILDLDVAGMRVGVEEAIVENLRGVVVE